MTDHDLPRDPLVDDALERYVSPDPWPDDWAAISARAGRRRARRIPVVGGAVAVAACTALVILTIAFTQADGDHAPSAAGAGASGLASGQQAAETWGITVDPVDAAPKQSTPFFETAFPEIDANDALVRSEIDGTGFLLGPRAGDGSLCYTVSISSADPFGARMAACHFSRDLIAERGIAYAVTRSAEPDIKTLYGIAPAGVVRITSGDTAVDVKDGAFIIAVPSSVTDLTAIRADGTRTGFSTTASRVEAARP